MRSIGSTLQKRFGAKLHNLMSQAARPGSPSRQRQGRNAALGINASKAVWSEATQFNVTGGEAWIAEPPASRQKCSPWDQRCKSGLERSDIKKWRPDYG